MQRRQQAVWRSSRLRLCSVDMSVRLRAPRLSLLELLVGILGEERGQWWVIKNLPHPPRLFYQQEDSKDLSLTHLLKTTLYSLGYASLKYPVCIFFEVLLEELCELQQWRPSGERRALHQTLLVEDKEIGGTGYNNATPIFPWPGDATGLDVGGELVQKFRQTPAI